MKQINLLLTALVVLCLSCDCFSQHKKSSSNLEEAKKAIAESNAIYFQAFSKNDSSIFINRYAEDCWIMAPHISGLCGPKASLEFFKLAYNKVGLRNGKFVTQEVYGLDGDYVVEQGLWQSFDGDGKMFDDGKYLVLWRKTAKGWKMFRDSFSSDH